MKDLAVLIPVHDDQEELLDSLDSIDEPDASFTVFVIDDGSPVPVDVDPSRYPFEVRVIRQTPNGGIVAALNCGLEEIRRAGFRFVARLDAADLHRRGRLARQYAVLAEQPEIAMVGSNAVFRDESNGAELFQTKLPATSKAIRRWMVFRNCFIHPTVMIRISALDEIGVYSDHFRHVEDYELFGRIAKRFETANLEEPLVDCFVRAGGISRKHAVPQLIAGMRLRWSDPRPFDPLWYAFFAKRIGYLVVPHRLRSVAKRWLGFAGRETIPPKVAMASGEISKTTS